MAKLKPMKPVDEHCPRCHAFDWEATDSEEGWMVWTCRVCAWVARKVWRER
jgi:Zn-finger protein